MKRFSGSSGMQTSRLCCCGSLSSPSGMACTLRHSRSKGKTGPMDKKQKDELTFAPPLIYVNSNDKDY